MKLLVTLAFLVSLGLCAAAQAPAAAGAAAAAAPASAAASASRTSAMPGRAGRYLEVGPRTNLDSAQPEQTRPSVHRSRHWLRWAAIGAAVIVGVIAIIAYEKNYGGTSRVTTASQ